MFNSFKRQFLGEIFKKNRRSSNRGAKIFSYELFILFGIFIRLNGKSIGSKSLYHLCNVFKKVAMNRIIHQHNDRRTINFLL